ncbi:hypothetical protein IU501_10280 [Nocardia otitidiscaviarum]|uniref:hypothetical protein n=1 Tax=Nocardia otitidiscaviarum TaxID=1823 RepID=UPI000B10A66A|nr:hypothetical protein [Nocardia otitidiscaviarum]MBF6133385.1 hypothetical protein [Nocardia otitidiscaviarum]MBF6240631.1 hypothetical protein [Nocardia otitidiscaviarum]MBF6486781.1 hypothetical protein [Nocardia otitidiscaviarum]
MLTRFEWLTGGEVMRDQAMPMVEPEISGFYLDRDGDIWERRSEGWRLILQRGVAVDPEALWDWAEGHVRDYAPFTLVHGDAYAARMAAVAFPPARPQDGTAR